MAMEAFSLPDGTRLGRVCLQVADIRRSLAFYRDVLDLRVLPPDGPAGRGSDPANSVVLGAGGEPLVVLAERPGAPPKPPRTTGLYHFALLLPHRRGLAAVLRRLVACGWPLEGFADHAVSEAVYLRDPDGNGIELYADRPRESWLRRGDELFMTTEPLDLHGLLAEAQSAAGLPPGTVLGHVHLQVADLDRAERFYHGLLGFDVTTRSYPGARFLAMGGYHHHLGLNVWAGIGAPAPPGEAAGLRFFEIVLPGAAVRDGLVDRLLRHRIGVESLPAGHFVRDPDGNGVVLTVR